MVHPTEQRSALGAALCPGFTTLGAFTAYGRTISQTQFLTDRYVVTEIEKGTFVFLASHGERFVYDPSLGSLRRLEPKADRIHPDKLRLVIGEIDVRSDDRELEIDGFACQRFQFRSSDARIVVEGETFATRITGIDSTALRLEREHDAAVQPFSLPLAPDQVVVRSILRTSASGFDQIQSYRLISIEASLEDPERLERIATRPITG